MCPVLELSFPTHFLRFPAGPGLCWTHSDSDPGLWEPPRRVGAGVGPVKIRGGGESQEAGTAGVKILSWKGACTFEEECG